MARTAEPAGDVADLLLITDATDSMTSFLAALNASLPEIIHMSVLTGAFSRIGVLAYRDYCEDRLLEWSGWCDVANRDEACSADGNPRGKRISQAELVEFARNVRCDGGGDFPEAGKTALAMAHEVMREDATTVMVLYADAPPHFFATGDNAREEEAALTEASYGGFGSRFKGWTSACRTMAGGAGKKAVVHCVVAAGIPAVMQAFTLLSEATGGACLELEVVRQASISRLTIGILLAWMGVDKPGDADREVLASRRYFLNPETLRALTSGKRSSAEPARSGKRAIGSRRVCAGDLYDSSNVRPHGGRALNFAERYATDELYKSVATAQMRAIIDANPAAMAANPIFGKLWRAVSSDRSNAAREELIQLFGKRVEETRDVDEKTRLRAWLAASYDFSEDIMERVRGVAEEEQFPCVYLDPTQDFSSKAVDDDEDDRPLNEFTREDLLAIGRSCDYRILRRLGKVLTRLTYVEREEDLPQHIRAAGLAAVPRVPLALARKEYEREFWRVLLHAVLPGTMLARRPAALLAALGLRMGIRPLRDVADAELLGYRELWNTLDIPETWNVGCLNLLLDADNDYRRRVAEEGTKLESTSLLPDKDKRLFKTLVDYKMLELNLQTTLTARVGWTPDKTTLDLGPQVVCRKCEHPRSVTAMSAHNICGQCVLGTSCQCTACSKSDDHDARLHAHVRKDGNGPAQGTWVECKVRSCRAQYVVYNPAALNVPPKCFYCRHGGPKAPTIECRKCLNRIVYPKEYRPRDLDASAWECVACVSGRETVVGAATTPQSMVKENGRDWLLVVKYGVMPNPLSGRTLYQIASTSNLAALPDNVTIFPQHLSILTLAGKQIHNADALKSTLRSWVFSRRAQSGDCTLCFSPIRKSDLRPACGRKGCRQLICDHCRVAWYALNGRGKLINVAALSCPFCRRTPVPGMVSRFGITRMGDARVAIQESGEWIHAWCADCGFAKRYAERVCERAVSRDVHDWRCEPCEEWLAAAEAREVIAAAEAAEAAAAAEAREKTAVMEALAVAKAVERLEKRAMKKLKTCPGCGVVTEKTMGCDHIECPCGVHWCYACGEREDPKMIYYHMSRRHGGLWDEDEDLV